MSVPVPVEIASSAFTWTSAFSGGTLIVLLTLLIKQVGPWRKQTTEATDNLIAALSKRLEKVETQLALERRMNYITTARLEARHAAQRALDRHKFNNADGNLDALLRILEVSPEKAPEAARQARQARDEQRKHEQLEAAEIHKAEILAVSIAERHLAEQEEAENAG